MWRIKTLHVFFIAVSEKSFKIKKCEEDETKEK